MLAAKTIPSRQCVRGSMTPLIAAVRVKDEGQRIFYGDVTGRLGYTWGLRLTLYQRRLRLVKHELGSSRSTHHRHQYEAARLNSYVRPRIMTTITL